MAAPITLNAAEPDPAPLPPIVFDATSGAPLPTAAGTTPGTQAGAAPPAGADVTAGPPAAAPAFPTATEIAAAFAALPRPEAAPPAATAVHVTAESLDYLRPDAPFSFVRDAFAARFERNVDAAARLDRFSRMIEAGALRPGGVAPPANQDVGDALITAAIGTTTTVPGIAPPGYRPDLYVGALEFPRPLVDGVSSAPISDATPFTVPRFVSTAGLTADVAVEGTNPAPGTIVTELVTVTPKAVSGIFDASRELVDSSAGGVAIDRIATEAIRESWNQQTENRLATELNAAGNGTDVTDGATPTAALIEQSIRRELVILANRRKAPATAGFADSAAFGALVAGNTTDGRPILPYNAYGTVNVAGRTELVLGASIIGTPIELAWALTTHVNLLRRSDVYNFESPVRQWRWDEVIGPAGVRFALFGYQAARVLRPAGVTRITYTGTPTGFDFGDPETLTRTEPEPATPSAEGDTEATPKARGK